VSIPDFPTRWDANQLFDVQCPSGEAEALLADLEQLYGRRPAAFRKLAFHCTETASHLLPVLLGSGWRCRRHWMMTLNAFPEVEAARELKIREVPFHDPGLDRVYDDPEELRYRRSQDRRLGGGALIAEIGGVPAGATGWFVVDGIVRFRLLHTVEGYRRRGVATALIQAVVERTRSDGIGELCIHCPEDGPARLYRNLGFEAKGELWYCVLRGEETGEFRDGSMPEQLFQQ
jgi:GNAT superfamily N-acetyltransferase